MYIPKGTKISYRIMKIKNDEGVEEEVAAVNKDTFENLITQLGFVKTEKTEAKPHIEGG